LYEDTYIFLSLNKDKQKESKKKKENLDKENNSNRNTIWFLKLLSNTNHNCQHYRDFIYLKKKYSWLNRWRK
jgi:hypothetical protein